MNFPKLFTIVLLLIIWNIFPGLKTYCPSIISFGNGSVAFAAGDDPYSYNEIKTAFESGNNLMTFNRVGGLLNDLLREQKKLFVIKKGAGINKTGLKIEDLINEASLFASENNYDKSFKTMDDAHEMVMKSIRQLLKEKATSK